MFCQGPFCCRLFGAARGMEHLLDVVSEFARDLQPYLNEKPAGAAAEPVGAAADDSVEKAVVDPYQTDSEVDDNEKLHVEVFPLGIDETIEIDDTEPPSPFAEQPASSSDAKRHPWAVAPSTRGRSSNLTADELEALRQEQRVAELCGMKWEERGPDGPDRPKHWRGQALRKGVDGGKVRYANRGGKNKELYQKLAREGKFAKGQGKKNAGKGKATNKGKGKSEATEPTNS